MHYKAIADNARISFGDKLFDYHDYELEGEYESPEEIMNEAIDDFGLKDFRTYIRILDEDGEILLYEEDL